MGLSFALLALFLVAGSGMYGLSLLLRGIWDYFITLPANSLTLFSDAGDSVSAALVQWQLDWSVFIGLVDRLLHPLLACSLRAFHAAGPSAKYMFGVALVPVIDGALPGWPLRVEPRSTLN